MLCLFFFNDTATTEIYTLSLHDALPISNTFQSTPTDAAPVRPDVSHAGHGATSSALLGSDGRTPARAHRGMSPEATKSQMISLAVQAVTMRLIAKSPQSNRSRPRVVRASLASCRERV